MAIRVVRDWLALQLCAGMRGYINAFSLDTLDFAWRDPQIGRNKGWGGIMSTATGLVAYGDDAHNFRCGVTPRNVISLS